MALFFAWRYRKTVRVSLLSQQNRKCNATHTHKQTNIVYQQKLTFLKAVVLSAAFPTANPVEVEEYTHIHTHTHTHTHTEKLLFMNNIIKHTAYRGNHFYSRGQEITHWTTLLIITF